MDANKHGKLSVHADVQAQESRPWNKHSVLRRGAVTQWDTYFHQYEPVYTKVPVMMCPGCVHLF